MWIEKITNSKGTRYKYRERFTAANGRTITISLTLNSNSTRAKKQAADALREKFFKKEGLAREAEKEAARAITVHALCDEWFSIHRQTVKESTAHTENLWIRKLKANISPSFLVANLTADYMTRYFMGQYYEKKVSYSYVSSQLAIFKQIMRYAAKKGYIDQTADFLAIKLKRRPATAQELAKKNSKFLSRDELRDVLALIAKKSPRVAHAMEFIALTGLRCGELLALRWQDVDLMKKSINVNATLARTIENGAARKRNTPKNVYSYRVVQLDDRAVKILQWFKADNDRLRLWGHDTYIDTGYIFTTKKGQPMYITGINTLLSKLDYPKRITTHVFRHTHISLLAEMGVPLKAIMQRVGHHNPNTTLNIYTHVTDAMQDKVVEKLNAMSL